MFLSKSNISFENHYKFTVLSLEERKRLKMRPFGGLLGVAIILILLAGCWPFEPRKAEPPASLAEPKTAVIPANVPEIIEEIYDNQLPMVYLNRILNNQFEFFTDPNIPEGQRKWTKSEEISRTSSVLNRFASIKLTFVEDTLFFPDPVSNEKSVTLVRDYILEGSLDEQTIEIYSGRAVFFLVYESDFAEWQVWQWHDYKTTTNSSWGQLKNAY